MSSQWWWEGESKVRRLGLLQVAGWKSSSQKFSSECPEGGVSTDRVMEDIIHRKQSVLVSLWCHHVPAFLEAFSTVGRVGSRSCSGTVSCLHHLSDAVTEGWAVVGKHLRGICHFGLGSYTNKNLAPNISDPCYIFLHQSQRKELAIPPFLSVLVSTCCFSFSPHFSCSSYSF